MKKRGFDPDKYIDLQSKHILERIKKGNGEKLYLEFGGKLVHDKHAMRVLPGFDENAKIKLLQKLSDQAEVIICIYAGDIVTNKTRQDFGITYDLEVLRLIDTFRKYGLSINSVVVTRYEENPAVDIFINKLELRGIRTYKHKFTKGYPTDVEVIVSDEGYGANPYIETTKPLCVVTGPGGGSGKLATCLSQLYHENKMGRKARYAKFETFPVWNLPLKHPVNVAYEAATADLKDVNMIDSFHLDAYGETAINYNRDLEVFPIVKRIIEKITGGECEYNSPTDMGVNMVGFGIEDDDICREASCQEIIRRALIAQCDYKKGKLDEASVERVTLLMEEVGVKISDRKVVIAAREYLNARKSKENYNENEVVVAVELVKVLAGVDDSVHLISPDVIERIQRLKCDILRQDKVSLNTEEVLNALTVSASSNPKAAEVVPKLRELRGCVAHCTAILNDKDEQLLGNLGIDITCEPEYSTNNLYFK